MFHDVYRSEHNQLHVVALFSCCRLLFGIAHIPGRKGHATRFEWYEKSLSVRERATDDKVAPTKWLLGQRQRIFKG